MYTQVIRDWGNDCVIYPERTIMASVYNPTLDRHQLIKGKIDMLVVSADGRVGIYDFKCTPEKISFGNQEAFDSAKVRTFNYQLAIYRRMLQ